MGRQKQPVELLEFKGRKHLTKKEIEERKDSEVKAPTDKVKPPSYLDRNLKREFKKISEDLMKVGIMTNLDVDALARFLIARKMYLEVSDNLLKIKSVIQDFKDGEPIGDEYPNPNYSELLINQDKLFKQCRAAASDLGLTIASRCKLVVPKSEEDKSPRSEGERRFGNRL
jgi:P27 family predicted phage terminase small subunit